MSLRFRKPSRSAGFSLAEVLVALAVAAMMSAMLVRFAAGTRTNAAHVGETLEMANLGETLLARVISGPGLQAGRTDGRIGSFLWRIEIQPIAFTAVARMVQKRKPTATTGATAGTPSTKLAGMSTSAQGPKPMATAAGIWIPYRVAVAVAGPSGRKYVADTIRIGPPPGKARR